MSRFLVATSLLIATAGLAWAGTASTYPLSIDPNYYGYGIASGTLQDVRDDGSSLTYLGCTAAAWSGSPYVSCAARSESGYLSCYSYDPALIQAVSGIQPTSWIQFYSRLSDGQCSSIYVTNASFTLR